MPKKKSQEDQPDLSPKLLKFKAQIDWRDPNELTPYVNNAKTHPTEQIDKIAASIAAFGWDQPIVVDEHGVIIKGHGRREAALRLGLHMVPVIRREDLTEPEKMAARLADNRTAESPMDNAALSLELKQLDLTYGFNLSLTGYDTGELKELLNFKVLPPPSDRDPDDVPSNVDPGVRIGDLWILGDHRMVCGDSSDPAILELLMANDKATMIFTDPPYGVNFEQGKYSPTAGKNFRGKKIANDELKGDDLTNFLAPIFALAQQHVEKCSIYAWAPPLLEGAAVLKALISSGWHIQNQIAWVKSSLVLGRSDYQWRHENCYYGFIKDAGHKWHGGRDKTTVWEVPKLAKVEHHPTQKPVELTEIALANSTAPGDIILDVFAGSGSTLIGCEKQARAARCVELDTTFASTIIKRWEAFTGKKAILESTGQSYDEVESARKQ